MSRAAVRAAILHMLPSYLASAGVDAETILRQAGLTSADVQSPRIVARSQIHSALSFAARSVGLAEIGLGLGHRADPDKLGPIGGVMKAGATVESCLRAQIAQMPGMQSNVAMSLRKDGMGAVWTHRLIGDDETAWLLEEGAAAFNIRMMRHLLGEDWAPESVSFPHAARGNRRVYEDYFQAPVDFGRHAETRITFARSVLSLPLFRPGGTPTSSDGQASTHETIGAFRFSAGDIEIAVARMVEATLPYRALDLPSAAAVLGLSPRTLQRRLEDRNVAFEDIVDRRRHIIASERLARPEASVTETAMQLGYSDVAHFNRAFRRWEGRSPTEFRRSRLSGHKS